jgi:hypothetical protein
MYQLVVTPFLNQGLCAVIVGYQTFPMVNCTPGQMDNLDVALQAIQQQVPHIDDVSLIGHLLESHISALALALAMGRLEVSQLQRFLLLARVFDVPDHYHFETGQGLERNITLMLAAVYGYQLQWWKGNSPRHLIEKGFSSWSLPLCSLFLQ